MHARRRNTRSVSRAGSRSAAQSTATVAPARLTDSGSSSGSEFEPGSADEVEEAAAEEEAAEEGVIDMTLDSDDGAALDDAEAVQQLVGRFSCQRPTPLDV